MCLTGSTTSDNIIAIVIRSHAKYSETSRDDSGDTRKPPSDGSIGPTDADEQIPGTIDSRIDSAIVSHAAALRPSIQHSGCHAIHARNLDVRGEAATEAMPDAMRRDLSDNRY